MIKYYQGRNDRVAWVADSQGPRAPRGPRDPEACWAPKGPPSVFSEQLKEGADIL